MGYAPPDDSDTLTWLLTAEGCVSCGTPEAVALDICPACRHSQLVTLRPPWPSAGVSALAGLWAIGAVVSALLACGAWLQSRGALPTPATTRDSQVMRSLARLAGLRSLDAPLEAAPPPTWFVPAMAAVCVLAVVMTGGMAARRPWAFYAGLALSALPAVLGAAAAAMLRGPAALAPLGAGMLASALLALVQLATSADMLGVRRRISSAAPASSAAGLYQAGLALIQAGMPFLGARQLARALGKDPGNAAIRHALAGALEQIGLHERARRLREQATKLPL